MKKILAFVICFILIFGCVTFQVKKSSDDYVANIINKSDDIVEFKLLVRVNGEDTFKSGVLKPQNGTEYTQFQSLPSKFSTKIPFYLLFLICKS